MTQLLWRHRLPLLLLAAYWAVALGLYLRWERENWYPTTGDEPHHIVIGRSVVHHASLELGDYYRAEAERPGRPGEIPSPGAQHTIANLDGLWSVHSIGTGLLAAPAIALTSVLGYHNDVLLVRLTLVALSGAAVLAVWVLASLYVTGTAARVIAVTLTCLSLPLLIAANQVFPDLSAGIVGLCVLTYVAWRARNAAAPGWADGSTMALIATIPFLHYKLAPMAFILAIAVLLVAHRSGGGARRLLAICVAPAVALALFFAYNLAVDGDLMPTNPSTHVSIDITTLRWMFTFSLDRWHGFLLQNPAFFIGLLFFVPFLRRQPIVAVPALLCYLAAMGINAAHGAPGFSFAGRHAWTGAMMMIPAVIYGIGCVESMSKRVLYGLGAVLIALQVVAIAPLLRSDHDLTNRPSETWYDVYPSFFPEALNRFLPAIYNNDWWSGFAINYVYIAFAAALVLIGAFVYPQRRELTLPAAGGLLALTLPLLLLVSFVQADPPREPRRWLGSEMHRNFGIVLPSTVEADVDLHSAGIWTFGPYMKVAPGDYRVTFVYSADAAPDVKVGSWDVTGRAGRVRFAAGDLYGSNGLRAVATATLTVESRADGESFEMRTRFDDVADLLLGEIVLQPAD